MSAAGHHQDREDWYEIRLRGHLDQRWTEWLDGLQIAHAVDGTTLLRGRVGDQAALHGLLHKLRDLGLPLVSVSQVDPADAPSSPTPTPIRSSP